MCVWCRKVSNVNVQVKIILQLFLFRDISFLYDNQVDGDDDEDGDDSLTKEDSVSNFIRIY